LSPGKNHIAILTSRLDLPGGIERAVVNTANLFVEKLHAVTIIILDETGKSFYPLHHGVKIIQQPLSFGITNQGNVISRKITLLSDVLKLRKIIRQIKPGILISSEYPFTVAAVLAGGQKLARIYSWEHHHYGWLQKNNFWSFLCEKAYPKLDGIICLNKPEADYYKKRGHAVIIPNFIDKKEKKQSSVTEKMILSVGWLIPRKGIDMMLVTAKDILNKHPDWQWKLIGDGKLKEDVLHFIETEKLQGRFILQEPGGPDIEKEYVNASLFVLTSRHEAFPMVLLEAMSHGVPCISFNCPSGPSDIITDQEDGLLIEKENTALLSAAISSLIKDNEKRIEMGNNARINIQRFSSDKVYETWKEKIFT
jgi:glycosyltransferase involved in cell wall biosynthesis